MQDLKLVGVQEDGEHLLLTGPSAEHYRLPLDDALRAAARRDRPRLGQLQIDIDGGMRPREVQSLVRAGATAEEVAERSGWSVEKVRKYEGPIVAERVHVAEQARQVRVRTRGGGGSAAPTLLGRVGQRMRERGVDAATSAWDAYRTQESSSWTVVLTFAAGGRQRQAEWSYDPVLRTVEASDDEARWLSADEPAPAAPAPAVAPRASSVYDVEAEGGVAATVRRQSSSRPEDPVDLMTAMRQRTTVGRRSGRRRSGAAEPARREASPVLPIEAADPVEPMEPMEAEAPLPLEPVGSSEPPHVEPDVEPAAETPAEPDAETPAEVEPEPEPEPALARQDTAQAQPASRPKPRTSVPSWDDIMFGTKRD